MTNIHQASKNCQSEQSPLAAQEGPPGYNFADAIEKPHDAVESFIAAPGSPGGHVLGQLAESAPQAQIQPPPSNRGVTYTNVLLNPPLQAWEPPPCKVSCGLDWLAYSVDAGIPRFRTFLPHPQLYPTGEALSPRPGYAKAVGLTFGRVDWHPDRPEQKTGVRFSGSDFAALAALGIPDIDLLTYAVEMDARISRVDFRIDYHAPADVLDLYQAWQDGDIHTSARRVSRVITEREGHPPENTVYIGSRQSERFLRVYTKGVKEGAPFDWTRIELELKGVYATRWVDAVLRDGIGEAGCKAVRDYCRSDAPWYVEATEGDAVDIESVGRKQTGRINWLLETIFPLITRELLAEKHSGRTELREALAAILANVRDAHAGE